MPKYIAGLVSVIVPVYNREKIVGKTIESIMGQSYPDVEIVAVNDGSTDCSLSILRDYAQKHPGKIAVIDQRNAGQVRARNRGIANSNGEFIAFLDSDDSWEENKLTLQMPLFRGNVGLVYSGINEVDTDGNIIRTVLPEPGMRGNIYHQLLIRNRMTGGSVVVTRKALNEVGTFDESFSAAENWDLWIRISNKYEVDYIDKPLVNYMRHEGNMSKDNKRMTEGAFSILKKHLEIMPKDEHLKKSYLEAYASYYYDLGVQHFGNYEYRDARRMFIICWKYIPNYQDSLLRIGRSILGKNINNFLAKLKANKIFIS